MSLHKVYTHNLCDNVRNALTAKASVRMHTGILNKNVEIFRSDLNLVLIHKKSKVD